MVEQSVSGTRVLLVDDQPLNRRMIQRMLKAYDVACAPDGPTALEMAAVQAPDLVLLDVNMPDDMPIDVAWNIRSPAMTTSKPTAVACVSPWNLTSTWSPLVLIVLAV